MTQTQKIIAGVVGFLFLALAIVGLYFAFIKPTPKATPNPTNTTTPTPNATPNPTNTTTPTPNSTPNPTNTTTPTPNSTNTPTLKPTLSADMEKWNMEKWKAQNIENIIKGRDNAVKALEAAKTDLDEKIKEMVAFSVSFTISVVISFFGTTKTQKETDVNNLSTARVNRTNAAKYYAEKLALAVELTRAAERGDGDMTAANKAVIVAVDSVGADLISALNKTVIQQDVDANVMLIFDKKVSDSYTKLYNAQQQTPIQIENLSTLAKAYAIDVAISDKYFDAYIAYLRKTGKL